jgi:hypothetical protein
MEVRVSMAPPKAPKPQIDTHIVMSQDMVEL